MKRKRWTFWILVGAIILTALNLPAPLSDPLKRGTRDLLAPLQQLVASYASRFREAGNAIRARGTLPQRNRELQREVIRLRGKVVELEALREENFLLRRQLDFQRRSEWNLVAGTVIARDISGWWQTVRLLHPEHAGIRDQLAVMNSEGLVGRISSVTGRTADVLLISDPGCRVAVEIGPDGAHGILQGQGLSWSGRVLCRVSFINPHRTLRPGDEVVTSGLGGVFPKGIPVGTLQEVEPDEQGLHQSATVVPHADLSQLDVLFTLVLEHTP